VLFRSYGSGFTNTAFNESTVLKKSEPFIALVNDTIRVWYSDEHALTLGITQVTRTGTCVTADLPAGWVCPALGTNNVYGVTPFPTTNAGMIALGAPSGTLALSAGTKADNVTPVSPWFGTANTHGTDCTLGVGLCQPLAINTGASTCPGGCDSAKRPVAPALFCTDITAQNSNKGDWQIVGGLGHAPDYVSGTWKGLAQPIACSDNGTTTTCTYGTASGADPLANVTHPAVPTVWIDGPNAEPPVGGYGVLNTTTIKSLEAYGAEVRWNVNNQNFKCINGATGLPNANFGFEKGHVYRVQILIHDGDQNKTGGDAGQACSTIAIPPDLPPNTP
jgi:hypothetical protein